MGEATSGVGEGQATATEARTTSAAAAAEPGGGPALLPPAWREALQGLLAVTPSHKAAAFRGLMDGAVAFEKGETGGARLMLRHAKELRQVEGARAAAQKLIDEIERFAPEPAPRMER